MKCTNCGHDIIFHKEYNSPKMLCNIWNCHCTTPEPKEVKLK